MIAKGNQRSGGYQLATHLLNAHDNERVEVLEVRGAVANDLHGAFTEWHAQSKATNCTKYLYSLSVNPDQKQGHLSREQYLDFLDRVEKTLGLENQGRAVVFHWKKDRSGVAREHCHAVWSRIDAIAGRAVNIAHDHMKLRTVAQEFALEHERRLPPGMQEDRGPERHDDRAGHSSLHEMQQQERTGITKEERRAVLTQAWQQSTDGPSLAQRLKDAGYLLARGDKRAYVVIDRAGEVHSLGRQLEGVKAKDLKVRLAASHPADSLPSVEEARSAMAAQREALRPMLHQPDGPSPDDRRAQLAERQGARRHELAEQRAAMTERHVTERQGLEGLRQSLLFNKAARRSVSLLVRHIASRYQRHQQTRALDRRQKHERRQMSRLERNLSSVEMRETKSFETKLKREAFQKLHQLVCDKEILASKARSQNRPAQPAPNRQREQLQKAFAALTAQPSPAAPSTRPRDADTPIRAEFAKQNEQSEPTDLKSKPDAEREAERAREIERLKKKAIDLDLDI